jgi:hypothetical protein
LDIFPGWNVITFPEEGIRQSEIPFESGTSFAGFKLVDETTDQPVLYFRLFLNNVPELKYLDIRTKGIDKSTLLDGTYLNNHITGFPGRGELVPVAPGAPTPNGPGGDFAASGLSIGGPNLRTIGGSLLPPAGETYVLDVRDMETGHFFGRIHYLPVPAPTFDISLYTRDFKLCFPSDNLEGAGQKSQSSSRIAFFFGLDNA